MRLWAVIACLVGACSFDASFESGAPPDPSEADAASLGDAAAAIDADPLAPDADVQNFHLRVEVLIDGSSYLIVHGSTVHWKHWVFAAPGRWLEVIEPTVLNGTDWYPTWPDVPTIENRDCNGCESSSTELPISVPRAPSTTTINEVQVRRNQNIIQEPTAANDYELIVEITDQGVGGGAPYIVEVDVTVD